MAEIGVPTREEPLTVPAPVPAQQPVREPSPDITTPEHVPA